MATEAARIAKLEKKVAKLEKDAAKLLKCCARVEKWIKIEVAWSREVTKMLRQINWAALAAAFPGGGGANPPQTPPSWPPA